MAGVAQDSTRSGEARGLETAVSTRGSSSLRINGVEVGKIGMKVGASFHLWCWVNVRGVPGGPSRALTPVVRCYLGGDQGLEAEEPAAPGLRELHLPGVRTQCVRRPGQGRHLPAHQHHGYRTYLPIPLARRGGLPSQEMVPHPTQDSRPLAMGASPPALCLLPAFSPLFSLQAFPKPMASSPRSAPPALLTVP